MADGDIADDLENSMAIKRTCMYVSNVLTNVVLDRSDQQSCGTCALLAWLPLF